MIVGCVSFTAHERAQPHAHFNAKAQNRLGSIGARGRHAEPSQDVRDGTYFLTTSAWPTHF